MCAAQNAKMKIALLGPVYPYRGGIAHHTMRLALALGARHEVAVISFQRQYPAWLYPGETDRDPSPQPLTVPAEYLLDPLYPWTWVQTARRLTELAPEMIVFQWWTTVWAPAFGALRHGVRNAAVVYVIHNVLPHEPRWWDIGLMRWALHADSGFVVQSQREQQRLRQFLPAAPPPEFSPLPLFDHFVARRCSRRQARQTLNLSPEPVWLLFFGIVRPYKGLTYLLDALGQTASPINLLIVGEFWESEDRYRQQITRLNLQTRVTIINRYVTDEEVSLFFSATDGVVAPYIGGTQSGPVKIALAFGLPLILSQTIAAELPTDVPTPVWRIPPGDVPALAHALQEFAATTSPEGVDLPPAAPTDDSWQELAQAVERAIPSR